MKDFHDYSDIIDLNRPVSKRHAPMPVSNRAAQFAPFAALTGFGEAINETGRRVDKKIVLSDEEIKAINSKLNYLIDHKDDEIKVNIVYFVPDKKKSGGTYSSVAGVIKSVLPESDRIVLSDKTSVNISDVKSISSAQTDLFD